MNTAKRGMLPLFRRYAWANLPFEMRMKLVVMPQRAHSLWYFTFHSQAGVIRRIDSGERMKGVMRMKSTATDSVSQEITSARRII
jgi:hypothetical protein